MSLSKIRWTVARMFNGNCCRSQLRAFLFSTVNERQTPGDSAHSSPIIPSDREQSFLPVASFILPSSAALYRNSTLGY